MTKYLQNFEFTFQSGSNFGKTLANFLVLSAEKFTNFTFFIDLLTNYAAVIVPGFNLSSIVLEWNEMIHKKLRHFSTFFWSVKLTEISRRTTNTIFCSPQIYCVSVVNKKSHILGFYDKIFAKFLVQVPKKDEFWTNFCTVFADVSRKNNMGYLLKILQNLTEFLVCRQSGL